MLPPLPPAAHQTSCSLRNEHSDMFALGRPTQAEWISSILHHRKLSVSRLFLKLIAAVQRFCWAVNKSS